MVDMLLARIAGEQACLEFGEGRMLEAADLRDELIAFFQPKRLAGKRVLITAGPTFLIKASYAARVGASLLPQRGTICLAN